MCVEVIVNGMVCENIGQLRDAIGRDPVWESFRMAPEQIAQSGPVEDGECLCAVDHDATAASVGMVVDMDDCLLWRYVEKRQ